MINMHSFEICFERKKNGIAITDDSLKTLEESNRE